MSPYAYLLAAEGARLFGAGFFYFPLFALAALQAESPLQATLAAAFLHLAGLLALPLGAVADRVDRRKALVLVSSFQALFTLVLLVAIAMELASLLFLYLLVFLFQALDTLRRVTAGAVLAALVPRERLEGAMGRLNAVHFAADALSDPLAGTLFARAPVLPPLLGVPLLFIAAGLYRKLPAMGRPARRVFRLREVTEGLRFLLEIPYLRRILVQSAFLSLVYALLGALLPFLVLRGLEESAAVLGVLSALLGLGAMAGALLVERLVSLGRARLLRLALFFLGGLALLMGLLPPWPLLGLLLFLFGLSGSAFALTAGALRIGEAPDELRGRVSGGVAFLGDLLAFLGPLLAGVLAGFGLGVPLLLAGSGLLLLSLWGGSVPEPRSLA